MSKPLNRITLPGAYAAGRQLRRPRRAVLLGLLFLLPGLAGCGVKGPPMPPRQPPLPAVKALAFQVADGSVTLTWSLAQPLAGKSAGGWAFGIHRSRSALDQPACDGCPLVFERVGAVPADGSPNGRFSFAMPLAAGYHYAFKVRLEKSGRAGPDSQPVRFDYPAAKPAGVSETP